MGVVKGIACGVGCVNRTGNTRLWKHCPTRRFVLLSCPWIIVRVEQLLRLCIGLLPFFQQRQCDKFVGRNRRFLSVSDLPAQMHCSALDFTFASRRGLVA